MSTKNVTFRWNVSDVFAMIYHCDTHYVFSKNFESASREEQTYWRTARDGMGQDFLGHAVVLGRRQWVQWFLNNDWPVDNQKFSLVQSLNRADIAFRNAGLCLIAIKEFVGLSDLMEMMSIEQWKRFCCTWDEEDTTSLTHVFKNPDVHRHAPPYKVDHFLDKLKKSPEKFEVLQQNNHRVISRICQQNIMWLGTFDTFGWDVEQLTYVWENPLVDCVNILLSGNDAVLQSFSKIISAPWFDKMLCSPQSQNALLTASYGGVWASLLHSSYTDVAVKLTHRLLENLYIPAKNLTDLQTMVQNIENQSCSTPSSEVLKSFLSKQIISASLNNSVKSDYFSEKRSCKKM